MKQQLCILLKTYNTNCNENMNIDVYLDTFKEIIYIQNIVDLAHFFFFQVTLYHNTFP